MSALMAVLAVLAVPAVRANATTIRKVSFDGLCARAEAVFIGTVISVEARRQPAADRAPRVDATVQAGPSQDGAAAVAIHTYTTFGNIEWVKGGDGGDSYTVRTLGGCVGPDCLRISGMPRFAPGQRYIVFVRGNHRFICPVVGWWQGGFRVVPRSGGAPATIQTLRGRRVIAVTAGRILLGSDRTARDQPDAMTVQRFVDCIRSTVSRQAGRTEPAADNR